MLIKLLLAVVVFLFVAFVVGLVIVPEFGEPAPGMKVIAAISAAKKHRGAVDTACREGTLREGIGLDELGLAAPESYDANFRSRIDVEVASPRNASVVVTLKRIGDAIPEGTTVRYDGLCTPEGMRWTRNSSIGRDLLPE